MPEMTKGVESEISPGRILSKINFPSDMKGLSREELGELCDDLRKFIINHVSRYGGHLGANLGVIELTVALHYVFEAPDDKLVWDVGHQAYSHKIITGRRDQFSGNRTYKGISGFTKRGESPYDVFGAGHSSTSISAALGMATYEKYLGSKNQHVAIIGDGAMTAGMAFEAMNNAGTSKTDLLVILNDNCMSIDPNVGALRDYLTQISTSTAYNRLREEIYAILGKLSRLGSNAREMIAKLNTGFKVLMMSNQSNFFESLNFRYFGPVDGHNLGLLIRTLKDLKQIPGPKLLHCLTKKGKGFKVAEDDQILWHAPPFFDKDTGVIHPSKASGPQPPKYQDVFGNTLIELAREDPKITGVTPAMPSGSSLNVFMKAFPHRAFDVGIAEQHAVTFSAGMSTQGSHPFCNLYSSFMQRAYDQIIHDVCVQNLPVTFCLDRAGLVGADGATHHGAYDLACLRCLPNMVICSPLDEVELRHMMYTASLHQGPMSIRYPRGRGMHTEWKVPMKKLRIGKGRALSSHGQLAFLSIGHVGNHVREASRRLKAEGMATAHYDLRFVKPLDHSLLERIHKKHKWLVTVEDGCLQGGFGTAVLEFYNDRNINVHLTRLGIPDRFIEHGSQAELQRECGIDSENIYQRVRRLVDQEVKAQGA